MGKILFSHSYFYQFDAKQWNMAQPYPPLMTIQAASLMREAGFEVELFDTGLLKDISGLQSYLDAFDPDYFVVFDDGFNYLTKMCLTTMREAAFDMLQQAKAFGCKTVVCSSDATDHFEKYLDRGADIVIKGEGEQTLKELLLSIEQSDAQLIDIDGLAWKENGAVQQTKRRGVMVNLDELPMPAWDLVRVQDYKDIWIKKHGYFALNLATTRGCPFKCNWCAKPIYGNRYNSRSPMHVIKEISFLIEKYQADYFWMCDDIFGLKPGWVQEFNTLVQQEQLYFKYKIQSRADLLLKEDTIDCLAQSGLDTAWIGAESGSQKILDAMDKGTKIEQIYEATKLLKTKKVKVAFFIQLGYLGEVKEDIQKTIDMVLELMPDDLGVSVSYPLPGTKFYEKVKHDLEKKANWVDSDDLDMMFQNTYPKAYYKKMHRYLHKRYRRKQGLINLRKVFKGATQLNTKTLKSIVAAIYYSPLIVLEKYQLKTLQVHAR